MTVSEVEAIGVDLGGTKLLAGVADRSGKVSYERPDRSTGLSQGELLQVLGDALEAAHAERPRAIAAGLGIPCTIDRRRGMAIAAVNLPIQDVPIGEMMTERLGLPVFVDNDANLAALAEHRLGAARGAENVVAVTVGTGIGGGLILGGKLYRGSIGAGAELGHTVIDHEGPPCQGNCPNRGCVEVLASGTALALEGRRAAEQAPESALGKALSSGEEIDGRLVTEAALDGDELAVGAVELVGRRLGAAMSSWANIFNPDVIVVGGGVVAAGPLMLDPARAELRARALPPMNETPVVEAQFGPGAGMVGAALMAIEEAGG